ncbi:hypothetical protein PSN45_005135 [Yamadazyma tenuis]|nr:hypothetical protein PSN45_005135 [Yamadazyma tenuis]
MNVDKKLGWGLNYVFFVAVGSNAFFLNSFWLRTFVSKFDKGLAIGTSISAVIVMVICTLVGVPGFLAVWSGDLTVGDENGSMAFFILLAKMPGWIIAFVLIFTITICTCTFDSLQSAFVSTISNDIFRNRFKTIWARAMVVIMIVPIVVLAVKVADNILQIYLIADLISSSIIPIIFLGLSDRFFWFLTGVDVMVGGLGALVAIFIFGTVYYGTAKEGGKLLLIWNGLYDPEDWGAFGAFEIAPFGGILIALVCVVARVGAIWVYCKITKKPFRALQRPVPVEIVEEEFDSAYGSTNAKSDD